jgi:two-component system cell cycle sensor histidine kinase/response regulator CckA
LLFLNAMFGRAANVPDGQKPAYPGDLVVAEDQAALAAAVRRYAVGPQMSGDIAVRLRNQPEEPVAFSLAGVRGLGEAAVVLSLKDDNEEGRLKRQVAQATKMQAVGQLAGGVAHDFNNILTAIIGHCDLMLMRHTPGDSDYDDIQHIKSNSNRAASLTRQLLAFSRQQTLRPQVIQLPDIVSDVSSLLKRLIGENVKLEVTHGRNLGHVRADPGQIEQVIVNLAVNARDAMPDGGILSIQTFAVTAAQAREMRSTVLPAADYTGLRVSDTGMGIPPEILPKIFEPFFTTKEVGQGHGARPLHRLWHCQAVRRIHLRRFGGGPRHQLQRLSAGAYGGRGREGGALHQIRAAEPGGLGHRHDPAGGGRGYGPSGGRTRADAPGLHGHHRVRRRAGA